MPVSQSNRKQLPRYHLIGVHILVFLAGIWIPVLYVLHVGFRKEGKREAGKECSKLCVNKSGNDRIVW